MDKLAVVKQYCTERLLMFVSITSVLLVFGEVGDQYLISIDSVQDQCITDGAVQY